MHGGREYLDLLLSACDGTNYTMGPPTNDKFWTKFSFRFSKLSGLKYENASPMVCKEYAKDLHRSHMWLQNPMLTRPQLTGIFTNLLNQDDYSELKCMLNKIFKELVVQYDDDCVPESPPSSYSLKRASSGSSLPPEIENKLENAFDDLVKNKMLSLKEVAKAESYLSTSRIAINIFLREKDMEKRCAMIKEGMEMEKKEKKEKEKKKQRRI